MNQMHTDMSFAFDLCSSLFVKSPGAHNLAICRIRLHLAGKSEAPNLAGRRAGPGQALRRRRPAEAASCATGERIILTWNPNFAPGGRIVKVSMAASKENLLHKC